MTGLDLKEARILIVDDEVANLGLLRNLLDLIGYKNVCGVSDPRKAVTQMEYFRPDLICLDLEMPYLDGYQIMKAVQAAFPEECRPAILVLTADNTLGTKRKVLARGATDMLLRPFDVSDLLMRMRSLLQSRFMRREIQGQNQHLERKVEERTQQLAAALSELNAAQKQMLQQERLRAFSEMASGVVHDFNNALMSVIGYSDLLIADPESLHDKATVLKYLKTMNSAGRDAAEVVSRLRDFYRSREDGEVFVSVDLNKLVEEVLSLTQPKWKDQALAGGRAIVIDLDLAKVPPIAGNLGELRGLLTNLIFNAVDAMPAGGTITLGTACENDDVLLWVSDTGTGMSDEVRTRCMEPFFSTKGDRGTGLGLSMAFGTIKRHDGNLEIESTLGRGTTFRIRLPGKTAFGNPADEKADRPEQSLRVLVVDDDPVARDVVSKSLLADGHDIVTAANGHEAVRTFRQSRFDLILTGNGMPGMSGLQLGRFIKATTANFPVILVTGFSDPILCNGETPTGVDLVLGKPIPRQELRRAVAKVTS